MKKFLSMLLTLGMVLGVYMVPAHAQTISSNQTIIGHTNGNIPVTYTYTMPKSGYFYYTLNMVGITVSHTDSDGNVTTKSISSDCMVCSSMSVNRKTYVDNNWAFYGDIFTSDHYAFKKGTKVKINIFEYEGYTSSYSLTLHYFNPKNYEVESNNSRSKANKVALNKTYSGYLQTDDKDWFVYKAPKAGKYRVWAVVTAPHSGDIYAEIYNGYKRITNQYISEGSGWINLTNYYDSNYKKQSSLKLKKNQKLYIHISRDYYNCDYKFNVKKVK